MPDAAHIVIPAVVIAYLAADLVYALMTTYRRRSEERALAGAAAHRDSIEDTSLE